MHVETVQVNDGFVEEIIVTLGVVGSLVGLGVQGLPRSLKPR